MTERQLELLREMGVKRYAIQWTEEPWSGRWETQTEYMYDTLEEAQAAFARVGGCGRRRCWRIAEACLVIEYREMDSRTRSEG